MPEPKQLYKYQIVYVHARFDTQERIDDLTDRGWRLRFCAESYLLFSRSLSIAKTEPKPEEKLTPVDTDFGTSFDLEGKPV